ncbi:hypothetical protein AMATHDRAFT_7321 [Amanita thiersii Skay4041]|uniref:G-protein coupled receptors family 1 profile domain-containing protein n=1 Tax=Amanita thiersii Skay4041 TaxID=703135 RepID=A0A2A9N866_9AGAR|nr:hypothetical protein AMATHDRAFT_7321 [Amanita thiersii Skay4041]
MPVTISPAAEIVAIFVQSVFGGLYTATFLHCVRWLAFKDCGYLLRKPIKWPLLVLTSVILTLSITTIFAGFAFPLARLRQDTQLLILLKLVLQPVALMTAILADGMLIYRCWVLYGRRWRFIAFPLLMWLGYIGISALYMYSLILPIIDPKPSQIPQAENIVRMSMLSGYLFTIVINVYTTVFIIYRIWRVAKGNITLNSRRSLHFTMQVIVEFKSWDATIVFAVIGAINYCMIGTGFNLLLIRIAQNKAKPVDVSLSVSTSPFVVVGEMYRVGSTGDVHTQSEIQ